MAKKKEAGYLSARESRRIARENRKITNELEKKYKRKNVPESEYLTTMRDPRNVLEIDDLHTHFFTDVGVAKAVDGVTFNVPQGKTVGVVGESGCGKSVTSLSVMQLLQRPQGQIVGGNIRINLGNKAYDVTRAPIEVMQQLRGNFVSMVFQEPMTSLNPVFRIGDQIDEVIELHDGKDKSKEDIKGRSIEMLKLVGIAPYKRIFKHLIPNVMPQLIVYMTMGLGSTIITEATLSFLGLGVRFPFASWGNIINDVNDTFVLTNYWFIWIPAGVLLLTTVLAFNIVGDGLRDAFDPKMKR